MSPRHGYNIDFQGIVGIVAKHDRGQFRASAREIPLRAWEIARRYVAETWILN